MGSWSIHSIGNAAFLEQVLNAVAMITGTGDFTVLARIATLIGVIMVLFQSISSGAKEINWQHVLLGWIVYSFLFGASSTVTIEDAYSGEVRVVANVPTGVAVVGGVISEVGYTITSRMEQAFSTPSMTGKGFGSSLETLKRVRLNTMEPAKLGSTNAPIAGSDFWYSWVQYVQTCTTTGITLGMTSADSILNAPNLMQGLRVDLLVPGPDLRIAQPQPENCSEAWSPLVQFTTTTFLPVFKEKMLAPVLGIPAAPGADAEVTTKVQDALNDLGLSVTADDYIITALLEPIYYEGVQARYASDQTFAYATMVDDGLRQRAAQWSAEASLFEKIVRPMLTFLEGFIYAITPLMAFLVLMGPFGVNLVAKYLLILAWIQLWMPALSIVNLFINLSIQGQLTALEASGTSVQTMAGLALADGQLQTWLATGGMLASSVPALTLVLIYGSAVTATNLASRLQSGDYVDEKKVAPDTFQQPALVQGAPHLQVNAADPMRRTIQAGDVAKTMAGISVSGGSESSIASARDEAASKQSSFLSSYSERLASSLTDSAKTGETESFRQSTGAGTSQSYQLANQMARNVIEKWGITDRASQDYITGWTGQASAEFGVNKGSGGGGKPDESKVKDFVKKFGGLFGGGINLSGSASGLQGLNESQQKEMASDIARAVTSNDALSAQFNDQVMRESATVNETGRVFGLTKEEGKSISKNASEAFQASQSYREAVTAKQAFGTGVNLDAVTAANMVTNHSETGREATRQLESAVMRYNLQDAVGKLLNEHPEWKGAFAGDEDRAWAYAAMTTLDGRNSYAPATGAQAESQRDALSSIIAKASGYGIGETAGASRNEGVASGEIGQMQSPRDTTIGGPDIHRPGEAALPSHDEMRTRYENRAEQVAANPNMKERVESVVHDGLDVAHKSISGINNGNGAKEAAQWVSGTANELLGGGRK